MNFNPIIILWGEPNSVFTEIFLKSIRLYKKKTHYLNWITRSI